MASTTLILDQKHLLQKIKRMAFEIYERNFKEKELVLAGIDKNGFMFANLLKIQLEQISDLKVSLLKISLDKNVNVQTEIHLDQPLELFKDKVVILTDDVLNTGRVLAYALKPFLEAGTRKLQTAVIIDRSHQLFPIVADYVGYSLATTIREHIEVSLEEKDFGVYLH